MAQGAGDGLGLRQDGGEDGDAGLADNLFIIPLSAL